MLYSRNSEAAPAGTRDGLTPQPGTSRKGVAPMIEHPTTDAAERGEPFFAAGPYRSQPTTDQYAAKAILRLAKYIDATTTQSDHLLSELERAFASQSLTRLADAASTILRLAEAKTWGGGR